MSQQRKHHARCYSIWIVSSVNGSCICQHGSFRSTREYVCKKEHISSTYSTRKSLVLGTYLHVWYGPVEVYMRVLSTWHVPVQKIRICIRELKQHVLVCIHDTGHLKLYVLVGYVLRIFASNLV